MFLITQADMRLFLTVGLNGLSLAALYFIVASGFSLVFGLMRVVNMAHGALYLLGAYVGYEASVAASSWITGLLCGALAAAAVGALLQFAFFDRLQGHDLRQTLVSIGAAIVLGDLMLAYWGGLTYQLDLPDTFNGFLALPIVGHYPVARLLLIGIALLLGTLLWLVLHRTRLGILIRAGVDDRAMLEALGKNMSLVSLGVAAIGGGLAGLAGGVGGSVLSISPGEDARYLLASLVVVIVGGMGSVAGAAVGAGLVAMAESYGQAYTPTYGPVYTFAIMVAVLALRPQGVLGSRP